MARTNPGDVQSILGKDYDTVNVPTLNIRIRTAGLFVDRIASVAASDGISFPTELASEIEMWIAAHLYAVSDKPYQSRSTLSSSASFQGQTGKGWEATLYGQTAKNLDPTGLLDSMDAGGSVGGDWLGKPLSEQIDYDDRN